MRGSLPPFGLVFLWLVPFPVASVSPPGGVIMTGTYTLTYDAVNAPMTTRPSTVIAEVSCARRPDDINL